MKYTNKKQKKRIANTQDIFNYHKNDKREAVEIHCLISVYDKKNSTVRILKTPKTESSVRKIFLPKSVAKLAQ